MCLCLLALGLATLSSAWRVRMGWWLANLGPWLLLRSLVAAACFGMALFPGVARIMPILRAGATRANQKHRSQRERPCGLLSVRGFHVIFLVGCQCLAWGPLCARAMNRL